MQPPQEREQDQARLNYAERQGGKELLNRRLSEQELSLLKLFLRTKRRKAKHNLFQEKTHLPDYRLRLQLICAHTVGEKIIMRKFPYLYI